MRGSCAFGLLLHLAATIAHMTTELPPIPPAPTDTDQLLRAVCLRLDVLIAQGLPQATQVLHAASGGPTAPKPPAKAAAKRPAAKAKP